MTTIAVTGASGHLGRLVIEHLLTRDVSPADIVALARTESKASDLAERGVTVRHADYDQAETLDAALEGVDRLVLVSGSEVGKRVEQHANVIAAAERAGVSRIVYTSLLKADESSNPLAPEHLATERALAESSIPATVLRNAWYLENYTGQIPQYIASGAVVSATKNAKLSGASRSDFAEAAAVAALQDSEGQTYELAGDTFTMSYLAEVVSALANAPIQHHRVDVEELVTGMVEGAGMDRGAAQFWAAIDTSIAKGDLHTESTDLADLIGHQPDSLEDAVRTALESD
ncbi:SDR family oxidoreductase [Demequina sp.]|uniref:SDR family oxidoreductase n=1 Tax=Demequina sp. TaxID=2050685 RepID=UPI003A8BB0A8